MKNIAQPKVSVVIPSYNRGYCIAECIRSVLMQTYDNFEIIVVDDASTDDTRQRVAEMQNPRVLYVAHEKNLGGAAARNTGIRHASGEYIAFLDSDDRWLPGKLDKQIYGMLENPGCGLSYTWMQCVDADDREVQRIRPACEGDCREQILISNFIGSFSSVVIRHDLLRSLDGLDESMKSCQDWDLFIRVLGVTHAHCLREPLVYYRQVGGDAVRISLNPRSVVQGHRRILKKFAARYRALPHARWREALHVYFNMFANVGAFTETLRIGIMLAADRAGPGELGRLFRGLLRSARRALRRVTHTYSLRGATR